MTDVVIASAARTAVGTFNGSLSSLPAHDLGTVAIKAALERAGVAPEEVEEVILGQILTAGAGQNPARQAAVNAGIPVERTAFGINQLCGSGLRAVALASQAIRVGDADILVAGGQESMSQSPHCVHLRNGTKMGETALVDTLLRDGLWDAFQGYHMGTTAENVAASGRSPASSRTSSPRARRPRPPRRCAPAASRTRSPRSRSPRARARSWSTPTSTRARPPPSSWAGCGRRSTRPARSPPATRRASTTARPRWC